MPGVDNPEYCGSSLTLGHRGAPFTEPALKLCKNANEEIEEYSTTSFSLVSWLRGDSHDTRCMTLSGCRVGVCYMRCYYAVSGKRAQTLVRPVLFPSLWACSIVGHYRGRRNSRSLYGRPPRRQSRPGLKVEHCERDLSLATNCPSIPRNF